MMTVSQKNTRSQRYSKPKKTNVPQTLVTPIESSQMTKDSDTPEPAWYSESSTIMDLQAYNLLAADLLEKVDVDHTDNESIGQIIERLWEEWKECYPNDDVPPNASRSLITRLKLIKALKHLNGMKPFVCQESNISRKKFANSAKDLMDLLSDKFAEGKFMNSTDCIKILVDLKSFFVIYELASGVEEDNRFRNYRGTEGIAFIDSEFQMATLSHLPKALEPRVSSLLSDRRDTIVSLLEANTLTLDVFIFQDFESNLRRFFVRIFDDLNAYSLPELHPDFEEKSERLQPSVPERDLLPLSNSQVASILTAMKQIPESTGVVDYGDLDDFLDGDAWSNSHRKKPRSGTPTASRKSRTGGSWTVEETDALEQGMELFSNDWKKIKDHFSETLSRRTNVNLKDRARNVKRKRIKEGLPLGIWHIACG